ncbi:hypothetical protein L6452_41883 [Arctium lappa]|uniref:Uncharacterized protein n=1 Tax=Arctium lappa TaxID=4217 RepID=A0ACB8XGA4_ARCLA|nr:hypothetical protein L6452_41883 [Arctium lappa]
MKDVKLTIQVQEQHRMFQASILHSILHSIPTLGKNTANSHLQQNLTDFASAPPPLSDLAPSSDTYSPPSLPQAPELAVASDVASANVKTEESNEASSGGMSSGKKAGIAIGVIGAVCIVGFGGMLYKKRQYNIIII